MSFSRELVRARHTATPPFPVSARLGLIFMIGAMMASPAIARERPEFPAMKFQNKAKGAEAVRRLGKNMDRVAKWYGMTPERLSLVLNNDRDAWLDEEGRLLYIDSHLPPEDETGATDGSGNTLEPGPYALTETFKLHSKPGSKRVIYLDFDGHTVTGSAWNSGTINAKPFSLDSDTSTNFSNTELERIQGIWQRVAEDYAAFDVDVTTEAPAADLLARTSSTDEFYGTRAVITDSSIGVCTGCGGVAYVGVFDWYSSSTPTYYQPAWVLYDKLGPGNEKYVAEAVSHEVGHNLGLSHDGSSSDAYYSGHGSGVTGWAPIMGSGYSQPVVQFSKGEYTGANNKEDDFQIIQNNGAALKTDAVGNTSSTASVLSGQAASGLVTVEVGGVIETAADTDFYAISSGSGSIQITATPDVRSPNLDITLTLLDAAGNQIASDNPADALGVGINVSVPSGTYYLKVDGSAYGSSPSTGYSDYGSVGRFTLAGSYAAASASAPTAVISATPTSGIAPLVTAFSSSGSRDADGSIVAYDWQFGDGSSSTEANPQHTYTVAGNYTATLTVTDSQGLKGASSAAVTVTADMLATTMHVDSINVSLLTTRSNRTTYYRCVAEVSVKNESGSDGMAVAGATVRAAWSGVTTSRATSATTNSNGVATFTSPRTTSRGTCTNTVSGISLSGWTYDPSLNVVVLKSLTY